MPVAPEGFDGSFDGVSPKLPSRRLPSLTPPQGASAPEASPDSVLNSLYCGYARGSRDGEPPPEIDLDMSWSRLKGVKYCASGVSSDVWFAELDGVPVVAKVLKQEFVGGKVQKRVVGPEGQRQRDGPTRRRGPRPCAGRGAAS